MSDGHDRLVQAFTWFLLPFAYKPVPSMRDSGGAETWEPLPFDSADQVWRGTYFMPETNLVLFRRARWFQTRPPVSMLRLKIPADTMMGHTDSKEVCVTWEQTRVVLFEYPNNRDRQEQDFTTLRNGILAIKLSLPVGTPFAYVLWLNEAFRYYKIPYWSHTADLPRHEVIQGLPGPDEKEDPAVSYHQMWADLLGRPLVEEDGTMWQLFPEEWKANAQGMALIQNEGRQPSLDDYLTYVVPGMGRSGPWPQTWDVYPDNRAFVWTCAVLPFPGTFPDFSTERLSTGGISEDVMRKWFALLNVDRFLPDTLDDFSYRWLRERTYTRWAQAGTLYGFNNYAVAMMSGNHWAPAIKHFETMYLDMGLLMLYVRTTLFRFSHRIGEVTHATRDEISWCKDFKRLRAEFSVFTNLYQFPLLSTQQQGIEMYTLMRKHMDVDEIFQEVQAEIAATHEYAELVNQSRISKQMRLLTILGVFFATAATVASLFGMNEVLGDGLGLEIFWHQTGWVVGLGVLSVIFTWLLIRLGGSGGLG